MTGVRSFLLVLPLLAAGLAACEGCRSAGGGAAAQASGRDPGPPSVRLYLLTDLAGALEPCGCTKDQLGGLDHFGAWVKRDRASAGAHLVAAAGPLFFMDDKLEGERADQDRAKADAIARVLHELDFAAFAPGSNDWSDGPDALARLARESGATPIGGSAPASAPLADAVVRDVGGMKIGFVGFGQTGASDPTVSLEAAVARGVAGAKAQGANAFIALAAVGRGAAKRLADAVPELTAVVVGEPRARGDGNTTAPAAEQVGSVLVVQAANHLQSVAVLDLYLRDPVTAGRAIAFADGTGLEASQKREDLGQRIDDLEKKLKAWEGDPRVLPGDIAARKRDLAALEKERDGIAFQGPPARGSFFSFALADVRASLGEDPSIEAQMAAYYKAVDEHNRVAFADRKPPPHGPDQAFYMGMDACMDCHAETRSVWEKTAHARAYATLSSQYKEFNLDCVGCHVTGYERPGGSTVAHVDKLRNVQCEVCHGPGSKHVNSPLDEASIIAKPQPGVCLECHHSPHVEHFDAVAKMKEILGPGHGMPTRRN